MNLEQVGGPLVIWGQKCSVFMKETFLDQQVIYMLRRGTATWDLFEYLQIRGCYGPAVLHLAPSETPLLTYK